MPNKNKVTIIGKRSFYSQTKNKTYYLVSWIEPSRDPNEGSFGYIGMVDEEAYNSYKLNSSIVAYTLHNGNYHQILPIG